MCVCIYVYVLKNCESVVPIKINVPNGKCVSYGVWYGMVWYGMVWYGTYGMVSYPTLLGVFCMDGYTTDE